MSGERNEPTGAQAGAWSEFIFLGIAQDALEMGGQRRHEFGSVRLRLLSLDGEEQSPSCQQLVSGR